MNWRDVPDKEHLVFENEYNSIKIGNHRCYHCDNELWSRYIRQVWATRDSMFVRRFHVQCA